MTNQYLLVHFQIQNLEQIIRHSIRLLSDHALCYLNKFISTSPNCIVHDCACLLSQINVVQCNICFLLIVGYWWWLMIRPIKSVTITEAFPIMREHYVKQRTVGWKCMKSTHQVFDQSPLLSLNCTVCHQNENNEQVPWFTCTTSWLSSSTLTGYELVQACREVTPFFEWFGTIV